MSKKEDPWRLDDTSGSLFCMPNNGEFEAVFPTSTPPFVFMQPVDDLKPGHDLVQSILEHRVTSILISRGFCFHDHPCQLEKLKHDFASMKADLKRWAWPKTTNVDHFSKTKEEQNQTAYSPSVAWAKDAGTTSAIWKSFVTSLTCNTANDASSKNRLPVFRSIMDKDEDISVCSLPRIECARPIEAIPSHTQHPESLSESTWREILLGQGYGAWERTIESHIENERRNSPMIPSSFSH